MKPVVLDTSALLAFLWQEPGWEQVQATLADATCRMSAVNLAEFVSKTQERTVPQAQIEDLLSALPLEIVASDKAHAIETGLLRNATRELGLSLGDRACLALARQYKASALIADRPWLALTDALQLDIQCIRPDSQ